MTLDEMVKQLDKKMTEEYEEYCELHEALRTYEGRLLTPEESKNAEDILQAIHEKYRVLHSVYYFIAARHQIVVNRAHDFDVFISSLEKAGIIKMEKKEESVIIQ